MSLKTVFLLLLISLIAALGASVKAVPAADFPTGNLTEAVFMQSFFGSYLPNTMVSLYDLVENAVPGWTEWVFAMGGEESWFEDWNDLSDAAKDEFRSLVGMVPVKYLGSWQIDAGTLLFAFEAGGWQFDSQSWGGAGFLVSHNMGMACYRLQGDKWVCSGYELDLGKFGSYCTTNINPKTVLIGKGISVVQTESYGSALIGVVDDKPKVLLRIPCWTGVGHGDMESFSSVLTAVPGDKNYYDLIVTSEGERHDFEDWDKAEAISQVRKYSFDKSTKTYRLTSSEGNIALIRDWGDVWLTDMDE